jgi:hypothetical protein
MHSGYVVFRTVHFACGYAVFRSAEYNVTTGMCDILGTIFLQRPTGARRDTSTAPAAGQAISECPAMPSLGLPLGLVPMGRPRTLRVGH